MSSREDIRIEIRSKLETLGRLIRDSEGTTRTDEDCELWLSQYALLVQRQAQLTAISQKIKTQTSKPLQEQGVQELESVAAAMFHPTVYLPTMSLCQRDYTSHERNACL
eukprot:9475407-Pyramimonas_sp.AAC.2